MRRGSEYAQAEISKLSKANKKRSAQGRSVSYRIAAYFDDAYFQTETYPTVQEAAAEFGVSNRTVQRALAVMSRDVVLAPARNDTVPIQEVSVQTARH